MYSGLRIGFGYDVHPLVEGRPLVLGGIAVPCPRGLEGHSDADVVIHALCDALLGALALGDLGHHFPSGDERWRGASSLVFLRHVMGLVVEHQYGVGNVDITVVAQQPRLSPYLSDMARRLAAHLGVAVSQVSVKATTPNGLGVLGQGAGIAAYAVCLLYPRAAPGGGG